MTRRGAGLFILMSVVWGLPYLLIKVAVRDLTPAMVVGGPDGDRRPRPAAAGPPPGPAAAACSAGWKPLLAYTVAELAVPWWLLSDAERRLPSSLTGLLVATVPLMVGGAGRPDRPPGPLDRRGLLGPGRRPARRGRPARPRRRRRATWARSAWSGLVAVGYATGPLLAARYFGHLSSLALAAVSLAAGGGGLRAVAAVAAPGPRSPATGRRRRGGARAWSARRWPSWPSSS